jgi:hypothetical protein
MKIDSPKTRVNLSAKTLFEKTTHCQNFVHFLSDQVKECTATEDSCSFTIENIAKIKLKILEKTPFTHVRFVAENDKNIPLFIDMNYTAISDNETDVETSLDIDLPLFLRPMLQKPLERFVETLSQKIKIDVEKPEL